MEMKKITQKSLFTWVLASAFLSQNLLVPVMCIRFEDQKHYYSPDPHAGTPPSGSHGTPSPSHGTPSHGGGGYTPTPSHGTTPSPSHGTSPSHGGGGYTPTPSHGGGSYTPTPSTPSHPPSNCGTPTHKPTPSTPSNPPSGGYYRSPPPSGGGISPPTPIIVSPPTTPTPIVDPGTPSTPGTSVPTPPFFPAPIPPISGTCDFWRTHPTLIWGLLGWWGTVGNTFGVTSVPGFGSNMNLLQALSNTRTDGLGALYREGTASWLNSMANNRFPFTTKQVRENFIAALGSNRASAEQARIFRLANEGLKTRS